MEARIRSVVNELIETSRDGEKGFAKSAEEVREPQIKSLFLKRSQICGTAARELEEQMRALGGEVEKGGSVSGALHRGWVNLKASVTGHDTAAILAEDRARGRLCQESVRRGPGGRSSLWPEGSDHTPVPGRDLQP